MRPRLEALEDRCCPTSFWDFEAAYSQAVIELAQIEMAWRAFAPPAAQPLVSVATVLVNNYVASIPAAVLPTLTLT